MTEEATSSQQQTNETWQRHPRGSKKEFLSVSFPQKKFLTLHATTFPCFHKESNCSNHTIGRQSSDHQTNTVIDLLLTLIHNQQIVYDRQQLLGHTVTTGFAEIKALLHKEASQAVISVQKPKEAELQVLAIAEDLEQKLAEVKELIQRLEGLIPS